MKPRVSRGGRAIVSILLTIQRFIMLQDIASPGGAAPAGKTTASAYTGDTGAESLQSVGFSAAACYAPSSKLPQDKPSLAVEDRPTTVRTGR